MLVLTAKRDKDLSIFANYINCVVCFFVLIPNILMTHPAGKQLQEMTTERQQEETAITNIHQHHKQGEAIHCRGQEEKYHQYLTLFYGEAT